MVLPAILTVLALIVAIYAFHVGEDHYALAALMVSLTSLTIFEIERQEEKHCKR